MIAWAGSSDSLGAKVENGQLFGRRAFGEWTLIETSDILEVGVFGWVGSAFVCIRTTSGRFNVGGLREQYKAVVEYLKENTPFDLTKSWTHRWNVARFLTPVSKLLVGAFLWPARIMRMVFVGVRHGVAGVFRIVATRRFK